MSGTEEQIEIDLGDMPKVEQPRAEEPQIEIVDEPVTSEAQAQPEEDPKNVENALKKLNRKLEQEKEARLEAERRAKELEQQQ